MDTAQKLRESRSRHLLRSSETAAKQLRVFKAVLPISVTIPPSSGTTLQSPVSSYRSRRLT